MGHWNYSPDVVKPVYVVSTGDKVELFVNGKSKGFGKQDYRFLFTFEKVQWEEGTIEAVSYNEFGKELSRYSIKTVGEPERLKLTLIHGPEGLFADGADLAMIQVEVSIAMETVVRLPIIRSVSIYKVRQNGEVE